MKHDEYGWPICDDGDHEWYEMHHYDDDGRHYCPTGLMSCTKCTATRKANEKEQTCFLWGKAND